MLLFIVESALTRVIVPLFRHIDCAQYYGELPHFAASLISKADPLPVTENEDRKLNLGEPSRPFTQPGSFTVRQSSEKPLPRAPCPVQNCS